MLLDKGAEVNAGGEWYGRGHVLDAASSGGHEKVVQMLLDAGARRLCLSSKALLALAGGAQSDR